MVKTHIHAEIVHDSTGYSRKWLIVIYSPLFDSSGLIASTAREPINTSPV